MMDQLITPERGKELRRAAAHHAGMSLITALCAGWDPGHYFPDEAERGLVLKEVERIGHELARSIAEDSQPRAGRTVDVSEWAAKLDTDGLEPEGSYVDIAGSGRIGARIHFAFHPNIPTEMRQQVIDAVGEETTIP